MTIRLPDEVDVLISGVNEDAKRDELANALSSGINASTERLNEIADHIIAGQKMLIACESKPKADALCIALQDAGCKARLEKE